MPCIVHGSGRNIAKIKLPCFYGPYHRTPWGSPTAICRNHLFSTSLSDMPEKYLEFDITRKLVIIHVETLRHVKQRERPKIYIALHRKASNAL